MHSFRSLFHFWLSRPWVGPLSSWVGCGGSSERLKQELQKPAGPSDTSFMRKTIKLMACALFLLWGAACQKVSPEISALSKGDPTLVLPAPKNGRLTLGSQLQTSASYKLKGRVSFVQPGEAASASYRLKGTVKF